jgi:hypothetical protein
MNIQELIMKQMSNPEILDQLGKTVGANPEQVQKLAQLGLPTMLEALNRNAGTPEGAQALAGALEQHQDTNVDDLAGFLKNVDTQDGAKILQHVLSGKSDRVQNNLARQTGLDGSQVSGLLQQFAPLLLGLLGNQKKEENLDAAGVAGLTSQLTNTLGQSGGGGGLMGMAAQFLDADKDGDIVDDLGKLLGGFLGKK